MSFLKKLFGIREKPMDWREFIEHFIRETEQTYTTKCSAEWGDGISDTTILMQWQSGNSFFLYPAAAYAAYCQATDRLQQIVQQAVAEAAEEDMRNDGILKEQILPAVYSPDFLDKLAEKLAPVCKTAEDVEKMYVTEKLADGLIIVYVVNGPQFARLLRAAELENYGFAGNLPALRQQAVENLRHYLQENNCEIGSDEEGLYCILSAGGYETSTLFIIEELLNKIEAGLKGDCVFVVPARGELIACGSDDAASMEKTRQGVIQMFENADRPISDKIYVSKNGTISVFQPH